MFLNGPRLMTSVSRSTWSLLGFFYAGVAVAPLACRLNSQLLAWLVTVAFFNAVGFSSAAGHLCLFIGFESKEALQRSVVTAAIVTAITVALHANGVFDDGASAASKMAVFDDDLLAPLTLADALAPFRSALTVMGAQVGG